MSHGIMLTTTDKEYQIVMFTLAAPKSDLFQSKRITEELQLTLRVVSDCR